ncbi:MAG: RnfABCDGE type electron transport complex subunit D [Clostridia bacterium]|nr:RnfABCDGE type electron transport complex subunit D [Clostridia bacterium]
MSLLKVSSSPHVRHEDTTRIIMSDVVIALIPSLIFGVYVFGLRALFLTLISVLTCVLSEAIYNKLMKKPSTVRDMSAVVSGILLAFNLPVTAPAWLPVIGGIFAMIIVKALFGGIGKNIMNPVLAARVFLFASWPSHMTRYSAPLESVNSFMIGAPDAVSSATTLTDLKNGIIPSVDLFDLILGKTAGCIGEVSSLLLLAGGLYLLVRRIITWHIPVSFIATVAVLTLAFAPDGVSNITFMLYELFSGGLILGAVFMATDYVTSPVTRGGRIIFGIGCGLMTVFIRFFGGYPEGVSFAILIMNLFVWYLDRAFKPTKFGGGRKNAKA